MDSEDANPSLGALSKMQITDPDEVPVTERSLRHIDYRRWSSWWGHTSAVVLLTLLTSAAALARSTPPPFPVIGKQAPDFALIDQNEHRVRLSQFRGKLILLNFIYTHCVDVCPIVTAKLVKVQTELIKRGWWAKDVVFISVTTDPARDLPPIFRNYAKARGADTVGWHFLTGDLRTVTTVHKLYGITARPAENGLQEHTLPTFVIDRKGLVLGSYGVTFDPQDVVRDLEKLR